MKLKNEKEFYDWYDVQGEDEYGKAIFRYAWLWASLMEYLMDHGYDLEEIADLASYEADVEGVTGFMNGAAAAVIAFCWVHGEQFRQWYNIDLQVGNEGEFANEDGGILNPALLRVEL